MSVLTNFHQVVKKLDAWQDDSLRDYFAVTESIRALADPSSPKILAVGMKGIGKTAAFRYLTEFGDGADVTVGIHRRNYTVFLPHSRLNYAASQKQFEHDLVVESLRAIAANQDAVHAKLKAGLVKQAAAEVNSYRDAVKKAAGRLGGISILGCGFNLLAGKEPVLVGLRPDEDVRRSLAVLRGITEAGLRVRIVIDDPELVFSASPDLDVHLIGGLLLAALELAGAIPNLRIIIFLKTHVWAALRGAIADLDWYPDALVSLSWTRAQLLEVLEGRIRWSGGGWNDVFSGPEPATRDLVAGYVCDHLRAGPRELLRWIDLSLTAARGAQISREHFEATRREVALYALQSMSASFGERYRDLQTIVQHVFQGHERTPFTRQELIAHIGKVMIGRRESPWSLPWVQEHTSHTLPRVLLETGCLGLEANAKLILPYDMGYDLPGFEAADRVRLVPALADAIAAAPGPVTLGRRSRRGAAGA